MAEDLDETLAASPRVVSTLEHALDVLDGRGMLVRMFGLRPVAKTAVVFVED